VTSLLTVKPVKSVCPSLDPLCCHQWPTSLCVLLPRSALVMSLAQLLPCGPLPPPFAHCVASGLPLSKVSLPLKRVAGFQAVHRTLLSLVCTVLLCSGQLAGAGQQRRPHPDGPSRLWVGSSAAGISCGISGGGQGWRGGPALAGCCKVCARIACGLLPVPLSPVVAARMKACNRPSWHNGCPFTIRDAMLHPRAVSVINWQVAALLGEELHAPESSLTAVGCFGQTNPLAPPPRSLCSPAGSPYCLPSPPREPFYHTPEEEIARGPACWLWDYLRR
jgi:hypothetical protein